MKHLVLAGLGHAHLFVLEALRKGELTDARVTLVCPAEYDYSGMISGVVAGMYEPTEARLPPESISRAAGAEWVFGKVRQIDAAAKKVLLDDGTLISYDLLSVDVGSRPAGDDLPGVREHAIPVKPVRQTLRFRSAAAQVTEAATPARPAKIVVVGGGASGTEISLCLQAAFAARFGRDRFRITIVQREDVLLPGAPTGLRSRALSELKRRRVEVRTGLDVCGVEEDEIVLSGRERIPYDALLWATGPRTPTLFRRSGLPVDEEDYLRVSPCLQVEAHPEIFGAGDCVAIRGYPWVAKAGVYAVREGPVLARNLIAVLQGEELEKYQPQRDWLSLLNTGDGRALFSYKGVAYHGRPAWWLKNWIDRRFVRRFQIAG